MDRNLVKNLITVNIMISALGVYCFTAGREGALIGEGRLLERGAY